MGATAGGFRDQLCVTEIYEWSLGCSGSIAWRLICHPDMTLSANERSVGRGGSQGSSTLLLLISRPALLSFSMEVTIAQRVYENQSSMVKKEWMSFVISLYFSDFIMRMYSLYFDDAKHPL